MNNDLIKRGLAIAYAASGPVRRIDGEDLIRTSDIKQSLNDVPVALFPLTVRINDKVTDENIESIKRLLKAYQPQILNLENEWIPITFRKANDDEYKEFIRRFDDIPREECKVYDCRMPDDGQEVLVTTCGGYVCEDIFCADPDYYGFENCSDPGDAIAWMPKPKAYKKEDAK